MASSPARPPPPSSSSAAAAAAAAAPQAQQQQSYANPHLAALPPPPRSRFDLPTAIGLAAGAFEAYLEPRGPAFRLSKEQRWSPDRQPAEDDGALNKKASKLTFVDADFLKAAYAGVLELRILSASGLRAVNRVGGKSDPYCVACLPDEGGRVATPVVWGCLDPCWHAEAAEAAEAAGRSRTHTLYVRRDPSSPEAASDPRAGVRFTVYDRANLVDAGAGDTELGTAALSVADVAALGAKNASKGGWVRKTVLMCGGAQATGALEVEARYLPFSGKRGASVAFVGDYVADEGPAVPGPAPAEVKKAAADLAASRGGGGGKEGAEAVVGDAAGLLAKKSGGGALLGRLGGLFGGGGGKNSKGNDNEAAAAAAATPAAAPTAATPAAADAKAAEREMAEAWRAVTKAAGRILHVRGDRKGAGDFRAVAFAQSLATDTEAWVGRSLSSREVVVAFRGTEMGRMKDAISDINAVPVPYPSAFAGDGGGGSEEAAAAGGGLATAKRLVAGAASADKVFVHAGFLEAWGSVRALVFSAVAAAVAPSSPGGGGTEQPWRVLVTGHSLGGALATLCTYELLAVPSPLLQQGGVRCPVDVAMYTYGAPRVGNVAFARGFHGRVERAAASARARGGEAAERGVGSWRLLNERDLVPTIPRLMGYAHVPYGVRLPSGDGGAGAAEQGPAAAADAAKAKAKAAAAVAGVLADERAGAGGTAADEAAADAAAASALDELEQYLIFEPATGSDPIGEGRDAGTLATDAARSARAAFSSAPKGGGVFSFGAIGAAASAAAGAVGGKGLVEHEMRIAKAMTDGAAIADHMEDVYLGKLVRALQGAGVKLPAAIAAKFSPSAPEPPAAP